MSKEQATLSRLACVASISSRGSSRKLGQEQKKTEWRGRGRGRGTKFCFRSNFRAITQLETLATQATSRGKLSKIIIDIKSPRGHVLVKEKFLLATVSISDHSRVSTQIKAFIINFLVKFILPGILLASPKKQTNKQIERTLVGTPQQLWPTTAVGLGNT